jgi:hypothetical protein
MSVKQRKRIKDYLVAEFEDSGEFTRIVPIVNVKYDEKDRDILLKREGENILVSIHAHRNYKGGSKKFNRKTYAVSDKGIHTVSVFDDKVFKRPARYRGRTYQGEYRLSELERTLLTWFGGVYYFNNALDRLELNQFKKVTHNYEESDNDFAREEIVQRDCDTIMETIATRYFPHFTVEPFTKRGTLLRAKFSERQVPIQKEIPEFDELDEFDFFGSVQTADQNIEIPDRLLWLQQQIDAGADVDVSGEELLELQRFEDRLNQ